MFKKVFDINGTEKLRFELNDDFNLLKWVIASEQILSTPLTLADALDASEIISNDEVFGQALEFPCKIVEIGDDYDSYW